MTDEKKKGWLSRLTEGLTRSSKQMTETVVSAVAKNPLDQAALDELEEMLIEADLGPRLAASITQDFGAQRFGKTASEDEVKAALAELIAAELSPRQEK